MYNDLVWDGDNLLAYISLYISEYNSIHLGS